MTDAKPLQVPLKEHEDMDRWTRLPTWAQQELEQWRRDEAHQRGLADALRAQLAKTQEELHQAKATIRYYSERTGAVEEND